MHAARLVVLAAALALPASAAAQPALTPVTPPTADVALKDGQTATLWAIGATAAGWASALALANSNNSDAGALGWVSAALIFGGPSAGHLYAGETGHALAMSGLRVAGATAFVYGILSAAVGDIAVACGEQTPCTSNHRDDHSNAGVIATLGALTFVGATVYDIADAHNAAKRHNDKARARAWQVAPSVVGAANGGVAPAVGFAGRW